MPGDKENKNSYEILGFGNIKNKSDIPIAQISESMTKLMKDTKNQTNDDIINAYLELSDEKSRAALDAKLNKLNPQEVVKIEEKYKNNPGVLGVKLKSTRLPVETANKIGSENMSDNIVQPRATGFANKTKSQTQGRQ